MKIAHVVPKAILFLIACLALVYQFLDWYSFYQCGAVESCIVNSSNIQNYTKFLATTLSMVLTFLIGKSYINKRDRMLLQAALVMSFLADFCLKATLNISYFHSMQDILSSVGIGLFMMVQTLFIIRHSRANAKSAAFPKILYFPIGALVVGAILLLSGAIQKVSLLVVAVYGVFLFCSLLTALRISPSGYYPASNTKRIKWGLILFSCCDICVGISGAIGPDCSTQETIATIAHNLVWFFYTPALVLLALSGYRQSANTKPC